MLCLSRVSNSASLHQSSPISQNKHKSPPNQTSQPPPNPFPSDEARYGWTHGIAERKSDLVDTTVLKRGLRVSLTLRRVRTQPCTCQWKALCDSWLADPSSALLPAGQQLEDAHVHEVYATTFPAIFFVTNNQLRRHRGGFQSYSPHAVAQSVQICQRFAAVGCSV